MAYKVILVDLDGVIRHWPESDEEIELKYGLPVGSIRNIAFSENILARATRGEISDETWRTNVSLLLENLYPSSNAALAIEAWSDQPGEIDKSILSILDGYCANLLKVLITNATSRLNADLRDLQIKSSFDYIVNSSEVGAKKPEPAIYNYALKTVGVSVSEALYVDDSLRNIKAAQSLGILSHRYENTEKLITFLGSVSNS